MRLLEYEAKKLLKKWGLSIPEHEIIRAPGSDTALSFPVIIKVQIPKGGRGKAGGVQIAQNNIEYARITQLLFSQPLLDCPVTMLLIEEALAVQQELYLSILLDRNEQSLVLLAHAQGGMDIEAASKHSKPLRLLLDTGPNKKVIQKVMHYYALPAALTPQLATVIDGLWQACTQEDALLVEVNPLILTKQGQLICADAKIELDDAAAFRHNWQFEAQPASTQFVILNEHGTIASMANGAGLAMATIDAIKAAGAEPANFFDVGGGTNVGGMVEAFKKMAALQKVKAIVVNIFGGITRCDEVAEAIITARQTVAYLPKLCIRLTGTNETEGRALLERAGIRTLPTLADCVAEAAKEVHSV
ncbi:MAG TPA: ATP-grasp domain-containing protein [Candidatus Saccharimonadales bacterium]